MVNTKELAEKWDLKERTIAKYCKQELIPNAEKINGKWEIPDDAIKPLNKNDIRRLLLLTVRLKNNDKLECDWSTFSFRENEIRLVYETLHYRKYISDISNLQTERIPYDLKITEKGFQLIENNNNLQNVDYAKLLETAIQIIGVALQLFSNK